MRVDNKSIIVTGSGGGIGEGLEVDDACCVERTNRRLYAHD